MEFDATFLIAAISFVVFVFIMNKILYAPVLKIMKARQDFVEQNFNEAKEIDKQTSEKHEYRNSELEKSRAAARKIIAEKSQQYKTEATKQISDFKSESYENISKERDGLRQSAIEAKEILKDNIVEIAKGISSKILGDVIDSSSIDKSQIKEQ